MEYNLESEISPTFKVIYFQQVCKNNSMGKTISSSNGSGTTGYPDEKEWQHRQKLIKMYCEPNARAKT